MPNANEIFQLGNLPRTFEAYDSNGSLIEIINISSTGGSWTSGASKGMTTVPPANDYLYICNGAASGGTFTAGKFLIEFYGYVA